jgi:hypothetical protein
MLKTAKKISGVPSVKRLSSADLEQILGGFGAGQSSDGKNSPPPPPPPPVG